MVFSFLDIGSRRKRRNSYVKLLREIFPKNAATIVRESRNSKIIHSQQNDRSFFVSLKINNVTGTASGRTEYIAKNNAVKCALLKLRDTNYPIQNIISFALYNLYTEWERNGYDVPFSRTEKIPGASSHVPDRKPQKSNVSNVCKVSNDLFLKYRRLPPRVPLINSWENAMGNKYKKLYKNYNRKLICLEKSFKRKISKQEDGRSDQWKFI